MTREEAIDQLQDAKIGYKEYLTDEALNMAIKALEQELILDKIRAEIIDTGAYEQETHGKTEFLESINYCLGVIDKYKADFESKESEDIKDGKDIL